MCPVHGLLDGPHARPARKACRCMRLYVNARAPAQRMRARALQSSRKVVCSGTALVMPNLILKVASAGENSSLPSSAVASSSRVSTCLFKRRACV